MTTATGSQGWVRVNTRNVLERVDKGAQLVEFNSGDSESHLCFHLGRACPRMKPAQGMQSQEAKRDVFPIKII